MKQDILIKLLTSIPIILLLLYFLPFIGVCLILFRMFIYRNKKISIFLWLITIGLIILSPIFINKILALMNIQNINIPYMNDFINSSLYQEKLIHYSKLLISLGIIFLILTMIMKNLLNQLMGKLNTEMQKYIIKTEQREAEIFQKNDLILKKRKSQKYSCSLLPLLWF